MYRVLKATLGPVIRWFCQPEISGSLPKSGPVILAPTHTTEIDSLLLCAVAERPVTFIAKAEYFDPASGRVRSSFMGWLVRATGQIPVRRGVGGNGNEALEAAEGILARGGQWGIYPEGTRTPAGTVHRGHTGLMRVALKHPEVPVIPIAIIGSDNVQSGSKRWKRARVQVRFGEPFDVTPWLNRDDQTKAAREATDALMQRLVELSGFTYVDTYAKPGRAAAEAAAAN